MFPEKYDRSFILPGQNGEIHGYPVPSAGMVPADGSYDGSRVNKLI